MKEYSFNDVVITGHQVAIAVLVDIIKLIDEGCPISQIKEIAEGCIELNQKSIRQAEGDKILDELD